jgi:hypothetical protein
MWWGGKIESEDEMKEQEEARYKKEQLVTNRRQ